MFRRAEFRLASCLLMLLAVAGLVHPAQAQFRGGYAFLQAVESRDLSGVEALFAPDAQIFESGGIEGNFAHYRDHHLAPELKAFKSFAFRDYKVSVRGEGELAIATETYSYTIVLPSGETVARDGVATSVLKWTDGKWQIISLHSSSRKPKV